MAHVRRYFLKGVRENLTEAVWFITQIRSLYQIEEEIRSLTPAERYERRLQQAPAILEAMKEKADELKPLLLPQSYLGKAVNYFINDYDAVKGYLEDGRFEIDNNLKTQSAQLRWAGSAGSLLGIRMQDGGALSSTRSSAVAGAATSILSNI